MSVMTVLGPRDTENLGIISPHEHVLVDIRNQFTEFPDPERRELADQKVGIENLDALSRDPYAVRDNLTMDDSSLAEEELLRFKKAGGATIVETTSPGIGRNPSVLKDISKSTGLNIVMGCGYYTQDTHPDNMDDKTVEAIVEEIVTEIEIGTDGSDVRAGVIGELGTSKEIYPNEEKVLIAAAQVQKKTGAGVIVHTYPWAQRGLEILRILSNNGVQLNKVSINHVDVEIDVAYCRQIAETGAYFEFDNFGKEYFIDSKYRGFAGGVFARDFERVMALKELIDAGCLSNIFISCDVCLKTLLHRYGGWGYDHILVHIVPMMLEQGITQDQIDAILIENPKSFLDSNEG
jgi:phosphotriesterase-related protein